MMCPKRDRDTTRHHSQGQLCPPEQSHAISLQANGVDNLHQVVEVMAEVRPGSSFVLVGPLNVSGLCAPMLYMAIFRAYRLGAKTMLLLRAVAMAWAGDGCGGVSLYLVRSAADALLPLSLLPSALALSLCPLQARRTQNSSHMSTQDLPPYTSVKVGPKNCLISRVATISQASAEQKILWTAQGQVLLWSTLRAQTGEYGRAPPIARCACQMTTCSCLAVDAAPPTEPATQRWKRTKIWAATTTVRARAPFPPSKRCMHKLRPPHDTHRTLEAFECVACNDEFFRAGAPLLASAGAGCPGF